MDRKLEDNYLNHLKMELVFYWQELAKKEFDEHPLFYQNITRRNYVRFYTKQRIKEYLTWKNNLEDLCEDQNENNRSA